MVLYCRPNRNLNRSRETDYSSAFVKLTLRNFFLCKLVAALQPFHTIRIHAHIHYIYSWKHLLVELVNLCVVSHFYMYYCDTLIYAVTGLACNATIAIDSPGTIK